MLSFNKIKRKVVIFLVLLSGCTFKEPQREVPYTKTSAPIALFDPESGKIPFPNDLLIDPETGRVNIPENGTNESESFLIKQINTQTGFSTLPVIKFEFSASIDPDTVNTDTVKVYRFDGAKLHEVYNFKVRLDTIYQQKLYIEFDTPLKEESRYLALLLSGIRGKNGESAKASPIFNILKNEKPLVNDGKSELYGVSVEKALAIDDIAKIYKNYFSLLRNTMSIKKEQILNMTTFKTLSVTKNLEFYYEKVQNTKPVIVFGDSDSSTPVYGKDYFSVKDFLSFHPELSEVNFDSVEGFLFGKILTKDFRTPLSPDNPTSGEMIEVGKDKFVNFILAVPKKRQDISGMPIQYDQPFKVCIFQHPFTKSKETLFYVANFLAASGFATIAIDAVEHGDRATLDINGDGEITSGEGFVIPTHLIATSSNIKQSVVDLFFLAKSLKEYSYDLFPVEKPDGEIDISGENIYFLGMSLGAMLGTIFASYQEKLNTIVLNVPGAYVSRIFDRSPTLGASFKLKMAESLNMEVSSVEFIDFFKKYLEIAQWILSDADPINYANRLKTLDKNILYQEVYGDDTVGNGIGNENPFEPNEVLAFVLQIFPPSIKETLFSPEHGISGTVVFKKDFASHTVLLTPYRYGMYDENLLKGQLEMKNMIGRYLSTDGKLIEIINENLLR